MPKLVMASTSPYRRALLDRLGVSFDVTTHRCDESQEKLPGADPVVIAASLARRKAQSVRASFPDAWILGGDQVAELDGEVLSKPGTAANALAQLQRLRGRTHRLLTAICLMGPQGQVAEHMQVHELTMRADLTDAALERYLDFDAPLNCCGSYKIESRGIALFERVSGDDDTAIVGLPLVALVTMLRGAGFEVP